MWKLRLESAAECALLTLAAQGTEGVRGSPTGQT